MPKVAIITRTKNRSIFLERALKSIAEQTFKDFLWVIVNDGGPIEPVEQIAQIAINSKIKVLILHRKRSTGMEAATNHGIIKSDSEYISIHDDDDTWEQGFLKATVSFLDHKPQYGGVITWNEIIFEHIKLTQIIKKRSKIQNKLRAITISDMLTVNPFPPIAFLYRRTIIEKIGLYDEELPVCGDYDFNLRFIEKFDIGVIPKTLASHHFRPLICDNENPYGNSEIAIRDQHLTYQALMRNRLFRRDLKEKKIGVGVLLQLNAMHKEAYTILERLYLILKKFYKSNI